jgi:hypothetical protein
MKKINPLKIKKIVNSLKKTNLSKTKKQADKMVILKKVVEKESPKNTEEIIEYILNNFRSLFFKDNKSKK